LTDLLFFLLLGEWIPAVSRKDKKNRTSKKEDTKSAKQVAKAQETKPIVNEDAQLSSSTVVQNHSTQTTPVASPEKKKKEEKSVTAKKASKAPETNKNKPAAPKVEEAPKPVEPEKPVEKIEAGDSEPTPTKSEEVTAPKSNVVFDEITSKSLTVFLRLCSRYVLSNFVYIVLII